MASKTTAEKPKTSRSKKAAAPAAEPAANGTTIKAQNIASASFVVPEEAFTVELPADPGPARKRHTFAKIPDVLNLPDLIELQKASFKWFISDGLDGCVRLDLADQRFHRQPGPGVRRPQPRRAQVLG